jgi:hypothetical protein
VSSITPNQSVKEQAKSDVERAGFVTSFLYFFKPPFPSDGGCAAASAGRSGLRPSMASASESVRFPPAGCSLRPERQRGHVAARAPRGCSRSGSVLAHAVAWPSREGSRSERQLAHADAPSSLVLFRRPFPSARSTAAAP